MISNEPLQAEPAERRQTIYPVIFLPGIITPAGMRYQPLLDALGEDVNAVIKDLEAYAGDTPSADYSIETEVEGILRAADAAGFERFHLYGYSGGGASALAFAASHPDRLLSLALDEPANDFSEEARVELHIEMQRIDSLPEGQRMGAFISMQLRAGVEPPPRPDGPGPEWMSKRPAGIKALTAAFDRYRIPDHRLQSFQQPVYYSYGSLSNPAWERMRDRLANLFPNFESERYEGLHHFNTSHAAEPERVARALLRLWERAQRDNPSPATPT